MKLLQTQDYLLFINEKAEIKRGDYLLEKESIINVFPDYLTDLEECKKIIAYRKLNEEAKELDLPKLPDPFKEDEFSKYYQIVFDYVNSGIRNFGAMMGLFKLKEIAQSKQFSLEDVKKAIEMCQNNIEDNCKSFSEYALGNIEKEDITPLMSTEEIIQSLYTQRLPKVFIPEYEYYYHSSKEFYKDAKFEKCSKEQYKSIKEEIPTCPVKVELKTITNSEGKQELVGIYKY